MENAELLEPPICHALNHFVIFLELKVALNAQPVTDLILKTQPPLLIVLLVPKMDVLTVPLMLVMLAELDISWTLLPRHAKPVMLDVLLVLLLDLAQLVLEVTS
jgi:hypothetical protein